MAPRKKKVMDEYEEEEGDFDEEPPEINPYEVLAIDKTATESEITKAYRKAALKHHPGRSVTVNSQLYSHVVADKAPEHLKSEAHTTFQSIAFAYAVLSDPTRRKRYDETGSTSESIVDAEGFNWSDYFKEQYVNVVSKDAIAEFSRKYKHSDEEKDDVLAAYEKVEGSMPGLYSIVMLSEPVDDEDRFRAIIDEAIKKGDVEAYPNYVNETAKQRKRRIELSVREGKEAMAYAEKLGVAEQLFGKNGESKGEDALMAMIQKKQRGGPSDFLAQLEAKYAPKPKASKSKKRAPPEQDADEPSEEAFQAAAARLNGKSTSGSSKKAKVSKK